MALEVQAERRMHAFCTAFVGGGMAVEEEVERKEAGDDSAFGRVGA